MVKIQKADEIEKEFFEPRDFAGARSAVDRVASDVRARGDAALFDAAKKFDAAAPATLEIPRDDLEAAERAMREENPGLYDSLRYSRDLAMRFALRQKESFDDFEMEIESGLFAGQKNIAVERAGVYVPAGRFPLVSTVVMTVTPAVAAGVKEIVLCSPPRVHPGDMESAKKAGKGFAGSPFVGGKPCADSNIMAAASLCGASRVFAVGGAQAVAAMAFGTKSIPKVDVIVGPGNKFVAEAKRLVYGKVGIDMIAGPTEVFIIADSSANPEWVAADMIAQAEHDAAAQSVLATDCEPLARAVDLEIEKQLESLPTREVARESLKNFGKIILADSLGQAAEIANKKAPEHLEVSMEKSARRDETLALLKNYGSLFIGNETAEALGDYAAGVNHTLPTSGSARFTGGLSVRAFLKTVTTLRAEKGGAGLASSIEAAGRLGDAEGLAGHARAARMRASL